eukprot:g9035.t1
MAPSLLPPADEPDEKTGPKTSITGGNRRSYGGDGEGETVPKFGKMTDGAEVDHDHDGWIQQQRWLGWREQRQLGTTFDIGLDKSRMRSLAINDYVHGAKKREQLEL